ncbi:MAG: chemotaxis response regulator protein-glutamate methylesterase [bacterium]|nr:chemotaxis response regulator protein-glutamate methylesterase [bacterium]
MRVFVADDAILFRRVMSEVLATLPDVEVIGQAQNGKLALQKVRELKPDLLTLDMEMPEMDGLAVLDAIKTLEAPPLVIVVSALTMQGGRLTLQALQKGAFDFITKPEGLTAEQSREILRNELAPRIKAISLRLGVRGILRRTPVSVPAIGSAVTPPAPSGAPTSPSQVKRVSVSTVENKPFAGKVTKPGIVLIGVSTGGPNALSALIPNIPGNLSAPILIVQHMPPLFTQSLAEMLRNKSSLQIHEAKDGMVLEPRTVYIAPGGRQMRLAPGMKGVKTIQITDDPPENNCKPAVDYLFRSVANHFPGQAMAVILTGMGSDGTLGLRLLKRNGCFTIAQDEASCVVYGMPRAAVEAGVVDVVLPLDSIAGRITSVVQGGGA